MKVALVGLAQSGKSTLLSAISGKRGSVSSSVKIEEAVVPVPDERLDWLTSLYRPKKTVAATVDCLDVPGFSFVDESGRTAARRMVLETKTVDMYVWVIGAFTNAGVAPYRGSVDPGRDLRELQSEFLLADLELVTTRIERLEKQTSKPTKTIEQDKAELALQKRLQEVLENEKPAITAIEDESEIDLLKSLGLLTLKPIMVVINVNEDDVSKEINFAASLDSSVPVITLCCELEKELAELDEESRRSFMEDLGIVRPASHRFIEACYEALGLISFLTVGEDEVRAWPVRRDSSALEAAGKVHSDIRRGFIRAETIAYKDLLELGSEKAVKAAGKMRLEGKTYIVQDGDIMHFRFNI